jgi:hypothetical protein
MPERMPEVEDRVSHAAKDGSPGSLFHDTALVSVAFQENSDGNDVAMQASRLLEEPTKLSLLSSDS